MRKSLLMLAATTTAALLLTGCAGSVSDPLSQPATLTPDTKSGVLLETLPPPARKLDVAVYNFPDLTGQNKQNDNFAEFSRATTQGAAAILIDVLTKSGAGRWFNVVERNELQSLLQERQVIQNTRTAIEGSNAQNLPALRFAGIVLEGGIIGYDANETSGGLGANYLGVGGNTQYRQDIVTVALRAVSVQTGRVLASVTTTKTVYSILFQGSAFKFAAVDQILQAEAGLTKNSPMTLAVREGIQLAVYALIFEGIKENLWKFKDPVAGSAFMDELEAQRKAANFILSSPARSPLVEQQSAASTPVVVTAKD